MRNRVVSLAILSLLLASAAPAQQFWDKKPYENWSKDECRRMLADSPWSQKYDFVESAVQTITRNATNLDQLPTSEASRQINYTAQLRSALPVRQAVVRQQLLAQKVDLEKAPQLQAQVNQFLSVSFADVVVVHVVYGSNVPEYARPLSRYWQQQTTERVKDIVTLIAGDGRRVPPIRYEALQGGGTEFEVTFPRMVDGKPLLAPSDKALSFEFMHPPIGGATTPSRILLRFPVKAMVRNGEVVY